MPPGQWKRLGEIPGGGTLIQGTGTDLLKMAGIPDASLQENDPFLIRTYTAEERRQADGSFNREDWLRRRFAAKEAVFKALGEDPEHARLNEIEIVDDDFGAPHVNLYGSLQEHAAGRQITRVHISISSDGEYALAYAIAESGD